MAEILLEADHVGLAYHELDGETLAVEDISFAVEKGEFLSIVGPSGCGKTSILSMIDGLMQPSRGRINLYGKSRPGYMLQRDHLLDWRTVEGNVLLGLQVKGMLNEETRAFTNSLLKTYGLSDFSKSYPRQLSGGMRQKVALIRTLACSPELLLLDEPFSALDYQRRDLRHNPQGRQNSYTCHPRHSGGHIHERQDTGVFLPPCQAAGSA